VLVPLEPPSPAPSSESPHAVANEAISKAMHAFEKFDEEYMATNLLACSRCAIARLRPPRVRRGAGV